MATKKDSYWFKHDSTASRDLKMAKIRVVYDFWGIGIYWTIIEFLREQSGYRYEYSETNIQILCEMIGCKDLIKFNNFINDSIELQLFVIDNNFMFSNSLNIRMKEWESKKNNRTGKNKEPIVNETITKLKRNDKIREEYIREEKKEYTILCEDVVSVFNKICSPVLSEVEKLSESRKVKIRKRINEIETLEKFTELFNKVITSDFLTGKNEKKWRADFDWLMANDNNWVKVMEGKYDKPSDAKKNNSFVPHVTNREW
jgi:hypothetical protein